LSDRRQSGIEEYVAAAERRILPQLSPTDGHGANYRAATLLAEVLESEHSDRLFKDMLAGSNLLQFPKAARLLGQSSAANHTGHYEEAYALATQSAKLFAQMGNTAGALSSEFEEAYALQLEAKAGSCVSLASKAADVAHESHYPLLEVQLLLEQAICSDMSEDLGRAKTLMLKALPLAQSHTYESFYVRGLTALAHLDNQAGDESGTWSAIQEGLALCWNRALPAVRAYSLYAILDLDAERVGHVNVQFAASFESVHFGFKNPDPGIEAAERMRLANAAIGSREMHTAQSEFEQAAHIFSAAPATDSIHWRELEARLGLARIKALQGNNIATTAATLLESLPELQHLSNRYLEFEFYQTLADLQWKLGNTQETKHFLNEAIRLTELGLQSLPTWAARSAWMEQHRQSYLLTTQLLLHEGKEQAALELWEHFRSADTSSETDREAKPGPRGKTDQKAPPDSGNSSPEKAILTYALGGQDLLIWVRQSQTTHAVAVATPHDLHRTVENFASECSRPDSDISNVRADAETLYSWLVGPVRQWLPARGRLIVEPDGILANVPFEALIDPSSSNYLEANYSVTVATTVQATLETPNSKGISADTQALIVAAPAGASGFDAPPPGAFIEARHVAQRFRHPVILAGRDGAVIPVQRELQRAVVFHFAGHATLTRYGAAMILADGTLNTAQTQELAFQFRRMKLAVFSACSTSVAGESLESQGLVSAFLHTGARNVIASRWNVDSAATTDFVDLFYDAVLTGHGVAESVQSAAKNFLRTPGREHPYYWAAFSTFGRT
jgi:CHAT domain-containing protein